jgi:hypothetical protein
MGIAEVLPPAANINALCYPSRPGQGAVIQLAAFVDAATRAHADTSLDVGGGGNAALTAA